MATSTGQTAVNSLTGLSDKRKAPQYLAPGQGGILSSLPTGLQGQTEGAISGMINGSSFAPVRQQANEAFVRASENLRSQQGSGVADRLGQGVARISQQGTENTILQSMVDKDLGLANQQQALQQQGVNTALDLAKSNEAQRQSENSLALGFEQLGSQEAQAAANVGFNYANMDVNTRLAYDKMTQEDKQFMQGLTSDEQKYYAGLDAQQQQFYKGLDSDDRRFYTKLTSDEKLAYEGLSVEKRKVMLAENSFGLEIQKYRDDQADSIKNQQLDQAALAVSAGDYATANEIYASLSIPTIDWSDPQERDQLEKYSQAMENSLSMIEALGPNADPETVRYFASQYGEAYGASQSLLGVQMDEGQLEAIADDIAGDYITPESQEFLDNYIFGSVLDWWTDGAGMEYSSDLNDEYKALQTTLDDKYAAYEDKEAAAKKIGRLAYALQRASSGAELSDADITVLKNAGYGETFGDLIATSNPEDSYESMKENIDVVDWTNAFESTDDPEFKKLIADKSLSSYSTAVPIVEGNTYDENPKIEGISIGKTSGKGVGKNHYKISAFDAAYDTNSPIVIGNDAYVVTQKASSSNATDVIGDFDTGNYELKNIVTGESYKVKVDSGSARFVLT